jgi:hypothetical protein
MKSKSPLAVALQRLLTAETHFPVGFRTVPGLKNLLLETLAIVVSPLTRRASKTCVNCKGKVSELLLPSNGYCTVVYLHRRHLAMGLHVAEITTFVI